MKKVISIITAMFILALVIVPFSAFAAGKPTFSVSSANANAGANVDIAIRIKNNPGISSAKLTVTFANELELQKIVYNDELGGMTQQPQTKASPVILNWINATSQFKGDADYAILTFKVSDSAKAGKYDISLSYDPEDVFNSEDKNVEFIVENGAISIEETKAEDPVFDTEATDDVLTIGATRPADSDEGNYTGEEINPFNPDEPIADESNDASAVNQTVKKNNIALICAVIAAAVVVIALAVVMIIRKQKVEKDG